MIDVVSRLIDGQFPNYQQILPKGHTTTATVDRDQLLKAVKLASLIASSSANIVKLQFGKEAEIGPHGERGRGRRRQPQRRSRPAVEGDGTTIAFNARYLVDVLQNVQAEQFVIELNGPFRRASSGRSATRSTSTSSCRSRPPRRGGRSRSTPIRSAAPAAMRPPLVLRSLTLRNLRAYAALELELGPGPQLVWGPNAAGKTTLIEAVVLLATGRSHRTGTDAELIRWGADFVRVEGVVGPRPAAGTCAAARSLRAPRWRCRSQHAAAAREWP